MIVSAFPRLWEFRAANPEVIFEPGEFGTLTARIPEERGETIVVRRTLGRPPPRQGRVPAAGAGMHAVRHARPR
jgi:hypothetical protein